MYGTLVRTTGWTFEQAGAQPAVRVFEYLEHLAENPPEYQILAAVYMKPTVRPKRSAAAHADEQERELVEARASGMAASGGVMPAQVRELLEWSKAQVGTHASQTTR